MDFPREGERARQVIEAQGPQTHTHPPTTQGTRSKGKPVRRGERDQSEPEALSLPSLFFVGLFQGKIIVCLYACLRSFQARQCSDTSHPKAKQPGEEIEQKPPRLVLRWPISCLLFIEPHPPATDLLFTMWNSVLTNPTPTGLHRRAGDSDSLSMHTRSPRTAHCAHAPYSPHTRPTRHLGTTLPDQRLGVSSRIVPRLFFTHSLVCCSNTLRQPPGNKHPNGISLPLVRGFVASALNR